jgi:arylsulfatase A-like enzyme
VERAKEADKPFFLWYNTTRIHIWTHLKAPSEGQTGLGIIADAMTEHDGMVGQVLKKLKDLGLEENTIVIYTSDNGAEVFSWPDGGMKCRSCSTCALIRLNEPIMSPSIIANGASSMPTQSFRP